MIFNIKTKYCEPFIDAPAKVKFCRGLYLLLVIPLCIVAFPIYWVGAAIEAVLDKLKDWLW